MRNQQEDEGYQLFLEPRSSFEASSADMHEMNISYFTRRPHTHTHTHVIIPQLQGEKIKLNLHESVHVVIIVSV